MRCSAGSMTEPAVPRRPCALPAVPAAGRGARTRGAGSAPAESPVRAYRVRRRAGEVAGCAAGDWLRRAIAPRRSPARLRSRCPCAVRAAHRLGPARRLPRGAAGAGAPRASGRCVRQTPPGADAAATNATARDGSSISRRRPARSRYRPAAVRRRHASRHWMAGDCAASGAGRLVRCPASGCLRSLATSRISHSGWRTSATSRWWVHSSGAATERKSRGRECAGQRDACCAGVGRACAASCGAGSEDGARGPRHRPHCARPRGAGARRKKEAFGTAGSHAVSHRST